MGHLLHVFPLISLHEITPITDGYQWNAHDHLEKERRCQDNFSLRDSPLISSLLPQTGTDLAQTARTAFLTCWQYFFSRKGAAKYLKMPFYCWIRFR